MGNNLSPSPSFYRQIILKGGQNRNDQPLTLSENPLGVHYLDIAENLFGGMFNDTHQGLETSWVLDIRHKRKHLMCYPRFRKMLAPVMVCEFLCFDSARFEQKVMGDEFLYRGLVTQYYLRMLEKLLMFCQEKHTHTLMMVFKGKSLGHSVIYFPYRFYGKEIKTRKGKEIHIAAKVSPQTLENVLENLSYLEQQFRQHLWRYQRGNLIFRRYLKDNPL